VVQLVRANTQERLNSLNNSSQSQKESEEIIKNITKRKDGRYMWRRNIQGRIFYLYDRDKKKLEKKAADFNRKLLKNAMPTKVSRSFAVLAEEWMQRYKSNIASKQNYETVVKKYLSKFTQDISKITQDELQDFINSIKAPRMRDYAFNTIRGVFKRAYERDLVKKDISQFLEKPKNTQAEKGSALNLAEQRAVMMNLENCTVGKEILFYLMTGCRRAEALRVRPENINFEKRNIFINRTKNPRTKGYVPISSAYAEILRKDFDSMFKYGKDYYTNEVRKYFRSLGIMDKTLHDLRHTFNTNLYYLKVDDKKRQYYMGHSSIVMTQDIYTHLDPSIKRIDIINIYNTLYDAEF